MYIYILYVYTTARFKHQKKDFSEGFHRLDRRSAGQTPLGDEIFAIYPPVMTNIAMEAMAHE